MPEERRTGRRGYRFALPAPAIDTFSGARSFVGVSRVRHRFVSLCLAAFWLVATQHCGLEAAGIFDSHPETAQACCPATEDHCSHDGCELVEGRSIQVSGATKLSLPQLAAVCCLVCQHATAAPAEADRINRPQRERAADWAQPWQFVQRAASSPRAPSNRAA